MNIALDATVVSSDGNEVGKVDRLALHPDTMEVEAVIVHQGVIFTEDRIVDNGLVERVDESGTVHLNITADEADKLPTFVQEHFTEPTQEQLSRSPLDYPLPGTMGGLGRVVVATPRSGGYQQGGAADSIFDVPTVPRGEQETESSLPKGTVSITEGTDVVDNQGEKVGAVDDIIYNEDGEVTGFVVQSGFIFTHDVRIPVAWVDSVTDENIRLNISSEEAEREGRVSQS